MKSDRGVLYMTWPDPTGRTETALERSIASVKTVHPELGIHVERLPEGSTLLDKARMFEVSPFLQTLFLDADTVVLERLDYGFEMSNRFGLACCICECPFLRRFTSLKDHGDLIEYNTGVLFFSHIVKRLFDRWASLAKTLDSSLPFMAGQELRVMPINDQASFGEALRTDFYNPYVLPLNWNFRPNWHRSWFGDLKIWHDYSDVPPELIAWNQYQTAEGSIVDYCEMR